MRRLLYGVKEKVRIEDLIIHDQFLHQICKKVNVPFAMNLPIFIAVAVKKFGFV